MLTALLAVAALAAVVGLALVIYIRERLIYDLSYPAGHPRRWLLPKLRPWPPRMRLARAYEYPRALRWLWGPHLPGPPMLLLLWLATVAAIALPPGLARIFAPPPPASAPSTEAARAWAQARQQVAEDYARARAALVAPRLIDTAKAQADLGAIDKDLGAMRAKGAAKEDVATAEEIRAESAAALHQAEAANAAARAAHAARVRELLAGRDREMESRSDRAEREARAPQSEPGVVARVALAVAGQAAPAAAARPAEPSAPRNPSTPVLWLAGFVVLLGAWWWDRKWRYSGGVHGHAFWSTCFAVRPSPRRRWAIPMWVRYRIPTHGFRRWDHVIGRAGLAVLAPPAEASNAHVLVIGASGSGKMSVFGHILATCDTPRWYQDEKAEAPYSSHPRMRDAIVWGCAAADSPRPSMQWNPVRECLEDADTDDAFENLARALVPETAGENAWVDKLGAQLLAELLRSRRWTSLADLADDLHDTRFEALLADVKMPDGLKAQLEGKNTIPYAAQSIGTALQPFRVSWGREVTKGHDFSLREAGERSAYIYGAETQVARRTPIRLLWSLLLRALMRSTAERPTTLLFDEAGKAGRLPNLVDALVTLRSKGVTIVAAFQSESLVRATYPEPEGQAVLDAFGSRITLLYGLSYADAESVSKATGTWTHHVRAANGLLPQVTSIAPVPLMPPTDVHLFGRRDRDRWAIISARDATTKGGPILARMIEAKER